MDEINILVRVRVAIFFVNWIVLHGCLRISLLVAVHSHFSIEIMGWRVPTSHDWYKRSSPGGSIGLACDRADQTARSRFVSGHLRSCSFSHGNKVFPVCAKCGVANASREHILSCLRLSRETFEIDPLLALDFLRVSGLMDGV
ncbi:hypothetical protein AVEN_74100-1 [Araneus ventricosus]|uniref:Uncharacterized protein n=1 Tax=Araneus ventricosus TaxID=182803 RepID=A0A4Y2J1P1_ARAVE|nr:hypothetical protein AVEN_74100-1 [Araneus ventricosus]